MSARTRRGVCTSCAHWGTTLTPTCFIRRPRVTILQCQDYQEGRGPAKGTLRAHRDLAEKALGRKLDIYEYVHHLNGNHFDNRPSNLVICDTGYHSFLHRAMRGNVSRFDFIGHRYPLHMAERFNRAMRGYLKRQGTLSAVDSESRADEKEPQLPIGIPTGNGGCS